MEKSALSEFISDLTQEITERIVQRLKLEVDPAIAEYQAAQSAIWNMALEFDYYTREVVREYFKAYPNGNEKGVIVSRGNDGISIDPSTKELSIQGKLLTNGNVTSHLAAICIRDIILTDNRPLTGAEILNEMRRHGIVIGIKNQQSAILSTILKQKRMVPINDSIDEYRAFVKVDDTPTYWPNDMELPE